MRGTLCEYAREPEILMVADLASSAAQILCMSDTKFHDLEVCSHSVEHAYARSQILSLLQRYVPCLRGWIGRTSDVQGLA